MRALLPLFLLLAPALAPAAERWQVVPGGEGLAFTAWWKDTAVPGRFPAFQADIRFDPEDPGAGRMEVTVDLTRVTTGTPDVDEALAGAEWFHFGRHPRARFTTEAIRRVGPGRYEADASLAMKGATRELVFPFTWEAEGDGARLTSTLTLDRGRWSIGSGEWAANEPIGLRVEVRVDVRLAPAPGAP